MAMGLMRIRHFPPNIAALTGRKWRKYSQKKGNDAMFQSSYWYKMMK